MKKIIFCLFIIGFLASSVWAQTAAEYFTKAVKSYKDGNYKMALEFLNKVNSPDIKTDPLRKEIEEKLKTYSDNSNPKVKSQQDLFNEALLLYNKGNYDEAQKIINSISDPNINTAPLEAELTKKINARNKLEQSKNNSNTPVPITMPYWINKDVDAQEQKTQEIKAYQYSDIKKGSIKSTEKTPDEEEPAVELSGGGSTIKNRKSVSGKTGTNDPVINYENVSGFPTGKVLLGIFLMLSFAIAGYVVLKNRAKHGSISIQFTNLSSNSNFSFNKSGIKIGRDPNNDFVINENGISRYHAEIRYDKQKNKLMIRDMGSTNGTAINGKKINISELKSGDTVKFSQTNYKINLS